MKISVVLSLMANRMFKALGVNSSLLIACQQLLQTDTSSRFFIPILTAFTFYVLVPDVDSAVYLCLQTPKVSVEGGIQNLAVHPFSPNLVAQCTSILATDRTCSHYVAIGSLHSLSVWPPTLRCIIGAHITKAVGPRGRDSKQGTQRTSTPVNCAYSSEYVSMSTGKWERHSAFSWRSAEPETFS